jgi:hypothetical protein
MTDITPLISNKAYMTARLMHGGVSSFDDNYIVKYVPPIILKQMLKVSSFVDVDGFMWGFNQVYAELNEEGIAYVCLASKYLGQGHREIRYIVPPSYEILQMHISW